MSKIWLETTEPHWNKLLIGLVNSLQGWPNLTSAPRALLPDFIVADHEKIAPHMLTLRRQMLGEDLDPEYDQQYKRILHKRHILEIEIAAVGALAAQCNARFALQRGFAFQSYYPGGYTRQFNDLDIVLPSLDDLARLLPALLDLGYFIARPAVFSAVTPDIPWIGFALNKRRGDLDEPVMLDVSVGGPTISPVAHWQIPKTAWDTRQFMTIGDASVPILTPTFNLLALFIEATEREQLTLRDFLDLDRLARQDLDIDQLQVDISALGIRHEVNRFRRIVEQARLDHLLPLFHRLESAGGALVERPRWASWLIRHIAPVVYRQDLRRLVIGLGYSGLFPLLDWFENRAPRLSHWAYQRVSSRRVYELGLPIYLFPAVMNSQSRAHTEGAFERIDHGDYVTVAGQRYLSRARPVVSDDELAAIGCRWIDE